MDNIRLTRDSNTRKMSMDNFSDSRSNNDFKVNRDMQQKMDLVSNKDIDIGLELLTNPEKRNRALGDDNGEVNELKKETNYSSNNYHNDDVEFDKIISNEPTDSYDNLLNEMSASSRLSGSEVDKFIDNNKNKPSLVDEHEVTDLFERRSNREDKRSQMSNFDRRSNRDDYRDSGNNYQQNDYRDSGNNYQRDDYRQNNYQPAPVVDYEAERKEKEELLFKLEKYRRMGVNVKKFNMSSDLDEMRNEYNSIKKQRDLEQSVKFQRNVLITLASGIESLNSRFDFFDLKLDGWSEKMKEDIYDYNEVFEELHEKYKDKAKIAPELKLLGMVGGSAFMFHLTNSMFKNSAPGIEEIMRQNPDLMRQFANAAMNQMPQQQKAAANFFSGFAPQMQPPPPQPTQQFSQNNFNTPPPNRNPQSNFVPSANSYSPQMSSINNDPMGSLPMNETKSIKKIPEPVGVDEILNELKSNTNDNLSDSISISNRSRSIDNRRRLNRPKRTIDLNME